MWKESDNEPAEHELFLCSPAIKHFWYCKSQLLLKNHILCYKWIDPVLPRFLIVVPKTLRQDILKNNHDVKSSGHFGQTKTLNRIKQKFIWYGMTWMS